MTFEDETRFVRIGPLPQASIGTSEIVLLDTAAGMYHGLRGPAARIWELLEEPRSLAEVCDTLVAEYDVEPGVCRSETSDFVQQLLRENLVVLKG
jgi:hypothetical protein